jgi:hypothetical protein
MYAYEKGGTKIRATSLTLKNLPHSKQSLGWEKNWPHLVTLYDSLPTSDKKACLFESSALHSRGKSSEQSFCF